ncbi:MAG: hypothetical protein RJB39_183 [Candidatus Parcubacteria bacterium]|jgi:hypothetical protein
MSKKDDKKKKKPEAKKEPEKRPDHTWKWLLAALVILCIVNPANPGAPRPLAQPSQPDQYPQPVQPGPAPMPIIAHRWVITPNGYRELRLVINEGGVERSLGPNQVSGEFSREARFLLPPSSPGQRYTALR